MLTEKRIRVQNIPIYITVAGTAQKTILFVHGNSASSEIWLPQLEDTSLNSRYKLVAIDLPGHGNSGKSNDYSLQKMASLLPGIITELGINEYILAGISYGSCVIAEAAPSLSGCKGFVLESPNITNNTHHPGVYIIPHADLAAMSATTASAEMLDGFSRLLMHDADNYYRQEYISSYTNTDPAFRETVGAIISNAAWSDEFANLLHTGLPCCVIFGAHEKVVDTHYMDDFAAKWHDQVFRIPGAAHFPNIENAFAFNDLLLQFAEDTLQ